jgi:hypothetical protein
MSSQREESQDNKTTSTRSEQLMEAKEGRPENPRWVPAPVDYESLQAAADFPKAVEPGSNPIVAHSESFLPLTEFQDGWCTRGPKTVEGRILLDRLELEAEDKSLRDCTCWARIRRMDSDPRPLKNVAVAASAGAGILALLTLALALPLFR